MKLRLAVALGICCLGCHHAPPIVAWQPAPGTLPVSYRDGPDGLEAAFELPEDAGIVLLGYDGFGRLTVLASERQVVLPLQKGFHRLRFPEAAAIAPTRVAVAPRSAGPATAAGVPCVSVQIRSGMVEANGWDQMFCGPTGLATNPYTNGVGVGPGRRSSRSRPPQIMILALEPGVSVSELQVALAPNGATGARLGPTELLAELGDRVGRWALLREGPLSCDPDMTRCSPN
ncbi:MAG: hypothetical protein AB7L66_19350 [Gemmatimonadales bacterium]